jgi:hypothetical protein
MNDKVIICIRHYSLFKNRDNPSLNFKEINIALSYLKAIYNLSEHCKPDISYDYISTTMKKDFPGCIETYVTTPLFK